MSLELKSFVLGELENNCYLVFDEQTKNAFLIDASRPCAKIKKFIAEKKLALKFIIFTHGHFDHISGYSEFDVPFYVHPQDDEFLRDPRINASLFCGAPITLDKTPILFEDKVPLKFEGYEIEVIHTPGHTPGSVCFYLNDWLFSGDTLFYHSIGRTDIPLASSEDILNSIKQKLLILPEDTKVYPGHGAVTTIGREKTNNPFL